MSDKPKNQTNDEKLNAIENTTQVPNSLITYNQVSSKARLLWIELWKYCWGKDNNKAWPGMDTIAEEFGASENTVRKYIKELEDENLLKIERPGLGKTNRYYMLHPETNMGSGPETNTGSDQGRTRVRFP